MAMTDFSNTKYETYKQIFKGYRYPLAFVDLDRFDENIAYVAATQKNTGKTIRVASKSIRCLDLIKRVFEKGKESYRGILAFTMEEAGFLFDNGLDDIIVAYPSVQPMDIDIFIEKTKQGATLSLMTDCLEQLKVLSGAGEKAGVTLSVCLDIDMSYRPFGNAVHIGVRRSPVHTIEQTVQLVKASRNLTGVRINSIMGYEAQVASVNDNYPGKFIKNAVIRFLKSRSVKELTSRRQKIVRACKSADLDLTVVNGGGSGSLVSTGMDRSVTEVTAGSAFFAPGLFRYFNAVKFTPAAFFGLQVTRIPCKGIITCQGGGYVGSGEVNANKLPWPVMPKGLTYLSIEGAGEVQTPLALPKEAPEMNLCDPVFFQHAKAGELCERFNCLYLVQNEKVVDRIPTYRGQGKAFL
jgi:D-serine deaminase-like pyridoxal phosphate-dependent protein